MSNPIGAKAQKRLEDLMRRIAKNGPTIYIRSAEGSMATAESIRGLRPAD